ncbi:Txe/YoeB family addiction module toxin [Pedobacter sp. BS3]|uniref:Txe/YoeB family addiction module toxin n=1 Tax=Pedobacter sp. BS3 TaxID=2567937 RepID=UPI0011ECBA99|nr:Txe/YoeB family addiction module toxin [Pedobacter sp. BS3]TZF80916.1 Txe/YoeB family addiction module toxin [Pedobacter sp. BS3]
MEIIYMPQAVADLKYWRKTGNKAIQKKIAQLLEAIEENPYAGIGKPEVLKHELSGKWSRRINKEHRIVYDVIGTDIRIFFLRGHYLNQL